MPVFETSNEALLPLATLALDGERVEYVVRRPPGIAPAATFRSDMPFIDTGVTAVILVRSEDAALARDVLAGLDQAPGAEPVIGAAPAADDASRADSDEEFRVLEPEIVRQIELRDPRTGLWLGQITNIQARFLVDELEGEDSTEARYFIDAATMDMLRTAGADPSLLDALRRLLGSQDGVEIQFSLRDLTV